MSEKNIQFDVVIQNVVAVGSLDQKIDLLSIMKGFLNVEYRPKRFPGLVFRLKRPKTATLIFTSGKLVCTGAKSEKLAHSAIKKVVRELKKGGIIILDTPRIKVENIVASADIHGARATQSWKVLKEALAHDRKVYEEALAQSWKVFEEAESLNQAPNQKVI